MAKIKVKTPVVEMDGDEMTRIIWGFIKEKLILPYLDIDLKYYDLGIEYRDQTDDQVTVDAANAIQAIRRRREVRDHHARRGPGDRVRPQAHVAQPERHHPQHPRRHDLPRADHLQERAAPGAALDQPIVIGRHAYGDIYRATEMKVPGPGKVTLTYQPADGGGRDRRWRCSTSPRAGVAMGMHNTRALHRGLRPRQLQLRS